jgi:hypothetical protein
VAQNAAPPAGAWQLQQGTEENGADFGAFIGYIDLGINSGGAQTGRQTQKKWLADVAANHLLGAACAT